MWIPEKGEKFIVLSSQAEIDVFVCTKRLKRERFVFIVDEHGDEHRLEDCIQPLNESELSTLLDMVQVSIEDNAPEIIDALNPLSAAHKRQMWDSLTEEMQSELLRLRKVSLNLFKQKQGNGLRTIIAGSRTISDYDLVKRAIESSEIKISVVISGKEPHGVDQLGERWAAENDKTVEEHPADWKTYGKAAGPIRNQQMAQGAEALILVWDGVSRGSHNMLEEATKAGLIIYKVKINQMQEAA